jgi:hypothetical protein
MVFFPLKNKKFDKNTNGAKQNSGKNVSSVKDAVRCRNGKSEEDEINAMNILKWDIRNFISINEGLDSYETAKLFYNKWQGYKKDYGEERIQEIIEAGTWRQASR